MTDTAVLAAPRAAEQGADLSDSVLRHLGERLAEAFALVPARPGPDRIEDLLGRLERALAEQSGRDEKLFRSELLEMMPRLHRFAMSLTKNPALAEDLVQDTLLRGWRSRARFEAGTNLGAWLFTIMRNAFYSQHRKLTREVSDSDNTLSERLAAIPEQTGHLDLHDAQVALGTLPAVMREALILVAIENMSYEDAAKVMNCQIGTVKSRVWRAREQLSQRLGFDAAEVGADGATLSIIAASGSATFA